MSTRKLISHLAKERRVCVVDHVIKRNYFLSHANNDASMVIEKLFCRYGGQTAENYTFLYISSVPRFVSALFSGYYYLNF